MLKLQTIIAILIVMFNHTVSAKSLSDLTREYQLKSGFVGVIYDENENKTYLKIDNLDSDFIYQTSLPSGLGSNDVGLDRGQLSNTRLVSFEQVGDKVFLRQKPVRYRAVTDNIQEAAAVEEAFASSILWGFPIVERKPDWVLVDASDFIMQDVHGVGRHLKRIKQGEDYKVDTSRSAIDLDWTKSFPDNTELQATITLVGNNPGEHVKSTVPDPHSITLKMHHSFIRLPDDGYRPRTHLPKSGYWSVQYQDYAQPINQPITQRFIARHRLAKQNPDAELSEAVEPIVYYLDPGVPEPVKSALIDGAIWWNKAFEAIGYKNAFQVKMLPPDADPMDVRYNVIQWVHRSTRGWSYGFSVVDPRTGEILKGHVTLGSLRVRQDYLIAQGMMAPFAEDENDEALMNLALARIRQLSAHEVGHTLGLTHNFAASNYGRESVMDYPHPQFELDGDKVIAPAAYGIGMGKWDMAAIAFGYQDFPAEQEMTSLLRLVAENDANGLLYISDQDARSPGSAHAYASLWDNGSDAVAELRDLMQIRKTAIGNFGSDNLKTGRAWSDLEEIFIPVYYSHRYQVTAAAKWIGGVNYDYASKRNNSGLSLLKTVSGEQQETALTAMLDTLSPDFLRISPELAALMNPKPADQARTRESLKGKTGVVFDQLALAAASAQHTLAMLLHKDRLARIVQQSAMDSSIPSIQKITDRLHTSIINKSYTGLDAQIHQSVVDLIYSNYLNLLHDKLVAKSVKTQILAALIKEQEFQQKRSSSVSRKSIYSGFHAYQAKRLENLSIDIKDKLLELPIMPPGSPI